MSSHVYVDTPNANLVCCICRSPFVDPCTTRTCCHTFCYECISCAIAIAHQCPIDRCPLSVHDLAPADPVVRNLVDELIVECPQRAAGCSYTCQRLLLPTHLKDSCEFVEIPCPEGLCTQHILRKDVPAHICTAGGSEGSSNDEEPERPVQDAKSESEHVPSSHSSSSDSNVVLVLTTENALLRHRVSALEGIVNSLYREMSAVKHALGPWYRPEATVPVVAEEVLEQSAFDNAEEAFEVGTTDELFVQAPSSILSQSSRPSVRATSNMGTTGDPADLASYFPPAEEDTDHRPSFQSHQPPLSNAHRPHAFSPQSQAGATFQLPHPSTPSTLYPTGAHPSAAAYAPSTSYATYPPPTVPSSLPLSPVYPPGTTFAPPTAVSVPPLDPTNPLPNTLTSLHSSLVTLAGALGALAAARGADALRTTEEVRGLRAAMHGLRMQVHDIMTSRSHLAGPSPRDPGADGGDAAGGSAGAFAQPWFQNPRGFSAPLHHPLYGMPPAPASITKL